ncbi:MAG: hypothetical protein AAGH70_05275 [Pseudomonadota bacterium]
MTDDLKRHFEEQVQAALGAAFVSVEVSAHDEEDGLPYYEVRVVYDAELGELSADTMLAVTEKLWATETQRGGDFFPVTYFTDVSEVEGHAA